jgi:3-hydroxyacyl-[acyl-carrier-protein] dehydratase
VPSSLRTPTGYPAAPDRPERPPRVSLARRPAPAKAAPGRGVIRVANIEQILSALPHRYPMLLVDRVLNLEKGKSCRGIKNVTINEPFFQGHYPDMPVMPGVLILEAMAQAGAMLLLTDEQYLGMTPLLAAIDGVKFRRKVVPGDQLVTDVELLWFKRNVGRIRCRSTVDEQPVAECEMTFTLIPSDEQKEP